MTSESLYDPLSSNRSMPEATVIPVLLYPDVPAAVDWLCRVFAFREHLRIGTHRVQLHIGQGAVVVAQGPTESLQQRAAASIMVRVSSVDSHFEAAKRAGATVLSEPTSHPYGERQYTAVDVGGHTWTFSQTEADVDPKSWGGLLVQSRHGAA